ncbi:MAG TPA: nucleotidyltransferase family protein [Vicinamibacterales bacterium]|nr:nucleotidyltransferase family protein [Vicinamibacterales bacterium]
MPSLAIVPAAGKAERFGGGKLIALIGEDTVLDRTLASLLEGGVDRIVVVIAPAADLAPVRRLTDPRVSTVTNADPSRGMFSSIQAGLAAAAGDPILVLPADMPFVRSSTVREVLQACSERRRIVIPTHGGKGGHPLAFPEALRERVLRARPTLTLKDAFGGTLALRDDRPVGDAGILRDVDVPADLERRDYLA